MFAWVEKMPMRRVSRSAGAVINLQNFIVTVEWFMNLEKTGINP
jgi:hypothetical protein